MLYPKCRAVSAQILLDRMVLFIVWRGPALSEVEEPAPSLSRGALARVCPQNN